MQKTPDRILEQLIENLHEKVAHRSASGRKTIGSLPTGRSHRVNKNLNI